MRGLKKRQPDLPTGPVSYPIGTYVETPSGLFYISGTDKRYRIVSSRVLDSWSPPRVVKTSDAAVRKYRITAKLRFRNGSLIWNLADAKLFLIESGKRRLISSPDIIDRLGIDCSKHVIVVSDEEVRMHPLGEELN